MGGLTFAMLPTYTNDTDTSGISTSSLATGGGLYLSAGITLTTIGAVRLGRRIRWSREHRAEESGQ